jgi:hypothetical protein
MELERTPLMTIHPDDLDRAAEAAGHALADRLNETGWVSALTAIAEALGRIADAMETIANDGIEFTEGKPDG